MAVLALKQKTRKLYFVVQDRTLRSSLPRNLYVSFLKVLICNYYNASRHKNVITKNKFIYSLNGIKK